MKIIVSRIYFLMISVFVLFNSCSYSTKKTIKLYNEARKSTYDLIIVPGLPLNNDTLDRLLKARIYWAKHLFDKGIAKNIMFSGNAVHSAYIESEVMALYAEALGIPKENIFTESKAEHSTENVYYSYKKARILHFSRIGLASDPFQTKMLKLYTRLYISKDIDMIPFVSDTVQKMESELPDPVLNYESAYVKDFKPLVERKSSWQRFKGTLGIAVDRKAYQ